MSSAPNYPAMLASLENELVNLITESLWQLERIGELQKRIREVMEEMERGMDAMNFPPIAMREGLN